MRHADNDNEPLTFIQLGLAAEQLVNSLARSRELALQGNRSREITVSGVTSAAERTEVNDFSVISNLSDPSLIVVPTFNAFEAGGIGGGDPNIGLVLTSTGLPEIGKPIIEGVSVDMVDLCTGPEPMHIEPDQSMSAISAPINLDVMISPAARTGRLTTESDSAIRPSEDARNGVVTQDIPKFFGSYKIDFFSHSILNRMRNDLALRELVNSDEKPNEESKGDRNTPETDEQREADKRRYVDTRLREIAAWERKIRNGKM
jgi:hypothetical protein